MEALTWVGFELNCACDFMDHIFNYLRTLRGEGEERMRGEKEREGVDHDTHTHNNFIYWDKWYGKVRFNELCSTTGR